MDSKKLRKLTEQWEAKLAKEGFDRPRPDGNFGNRYDSSWFANRFETIAEFDAKQEYFYRAEHFKRSEAYMKLKPKQKRFWDMHTDGVSNREIARKLKIDKAVVNKFIREMKKVFLAWKW